MTFFLNDNCTGHQGLVFWDNKTTMIAEHDFETYHNIDWKSGEGVENESSVQIPKGYELEMFYDEQFN